MKEAENNPGIKMIEDFVNFIWYSFKEFYDILDKCYNKEIFFKNKFGKWELKNPILKVL